MPSSYYILQLKIPNETFQKASEFLSAMQSIAAKEHTALLTENLKRVGVPTPQLTKYLCRLTLSNLVREFLAVGLEAETPATVLPRLQETGIARGRPFAERVQSTYVDPAERHKQDLERTMASIKAAKAAREAEAKPKPKPKPRKK